VGTGNSHPHSYLCVHTHTHTHTHTQVPKNYFGNCVTQRARYSVSDTYASYNNKKSDIRNTIPTSS
jgi:hypothetical protein